MHSKPVLGREEVARVLGAAREEAQRQGWAVSIAVVDDGGHPLALERLDGCAPIGAYIATEKARSAALGRRETKRYEDMINGGRSAFLSVPLLQATLRAACRSWWTDRWSARSGFPAYAPKRTPRWRGSEPRGCEATGGHHPSLVGPFGTTLPFGQVGGQGGFVIGCRR